MCFSDQPVTSRNLVANERHTFEGGDAECIWPTSQPGQMLQSDAVQKALQERKEVTWLIKGPDHIHPNHDCHFTSSHVMCA